MHPDYEEKLTSQAYVKRKKKGIPVFPSAGLMSTRYSPHTPLHVVMKPPPFPQECPALPYPPHYGHQWRADIQG